MWVISRPKAEFKVRANVAAAARSAATRSNVEGLQPASDDEIYFFCLFFPAPADVEVLLAGLRATGMYDAHARARRCNWMGPSFLQHMRTVSTTLLPSGSSSLRIGLAALSCPIRCRAIVNEARNVEQISELRVLKTIKAPAISHIIDLIRSCSTVAGSAMRMGKVTPHWLLGLAVHFAQSLALRLMYKRVAGRSLQQARTGTLPSYRATMRVRATHWLAEHNSRHDAHVPLSAFGCQ
jgi:hypothetical protein